MDDTCGKMLYLGGVLNVCVLPLVHQGVHKFEPEPEEGGPKVTTIYEGATHLTDEAIYEAGLVPRRIRFGHWLAAKGRINNGAS